MNRIEQIKLIAEFMDSEYQEIENLCRIDLYEKGFRTEEILGDPEKWVCYHNDFSCLMEVVEKIETLEIKMPEKYKTGFERNTKFANISITTSYDNRSEFLGWSYWVDLGTKTIIDYDKRKSSKLNATYEAVIRTIQWYNQNNK